MDQVKIGKFIAELRRRAGLTQEALGEKNGVTNKTISRWENGDYMPNIEMLQLLAEEFSISRNNMYKRLFVERKKNIFQKEMAQGTFFSFCCPGFDFDCRRRISPGISQTMASRYSTFGRAR